MNKILRRPLHLLTIMIISIYVNWAFNSVGMSIFCFILALLNLSYEIFEMAVTRMDYLRDPWNYLDFFGTIFFIIHCFMFWTGVVEGGGKDWVLALSLLCLFCRGIGDLRVFSNTRYLVRLILHVFKDMYSFAIILAVAIYGFSVTFVALEDSNDPLPSGGSMI